MSNQSAVAPFALIAGVTVPMVITHAASAALIRELAGSDANAFAAVDKGEQREAFVARCYSLYLAAAIHGDTSAAKRLDARARALPDFKESKEGKGITSLAKLNQAYQSAAAMGMNRKGSKVTEYNLSALMDQSFLALVAPVAPKVKAVKVAPGMVPAGSSVAGDAIAAAGASGADPALVADLGNEPATLQIVAKDTDQSMVQVQSRDADIAQFFILAARLHVVLTADQKGALAMSSEMLRRAA